MEELSFKEYYASDFAMMLEMSYVIGRFSINSNAVKDLNEEIQNFCDGINVYARFIKHLYERFMNEDGADYVDYLEYKLDEIAIDYTKMLKEKREKGEWL